MKTNLSQREKSIRRNILITWILFLLGLGTIIPFPYASHVNAIGYFSLCSFAPISTAILWGSAGIWCLYPFRIRRRNLFRHGLLFFFFLVFLYGMGYFCMLGGIGALSFEWRSMPAISLEEIPDGDYLGYSSNLGKKVIMKVLIRNSKMKDIQTLSNGYASAQFGMRAFKEMPSKMIEAQSIYVDTITGATHSSTQLQTAVYDALSNALKNKEKEKKSNE